MSASPDPGTSNLTSAARGESVEGRSPKSIQDTLGSGAVFAAAMAVPRAITFLLLPLYTSALGPAEYGELSIALAVNSVAVVLFAFGTDITIFRKIVQDADERERRDDYIASIWTFLLVAPLAVAALSTLVLAPFVWGSDVLGPVELGLALLTAALYVGGTTLPFALLRADNRLRDFVVVNASIAILVPALTVVAVVVLDLGVTGWFAAASLGFAALVGTAMYVVPYRRPRKLEVPVIVQTIREGMHVMPHFLSMWSLQLADRILLATLLTTSAVGIYSLASNMALPLILVLVGMNQALMPDYALAGKSDGRTRKQRLVKLRRTVEWQSASIVVLTLAGALIAPVAIHLLLDQSFWAAAPLAPWIVLGYGFLGLEAIPMNGFTLTHGKSRFIWVASAISAATNLGLIYFLVPKHGLMAAAIASAVGYAVLLAAVHVLAAVAGARLMYPWGRILMYVGIAVATYVVAKSASGDEGIDDLLARLFLCAVAGGLTVLAYKVSVRRGAANQAGAR